MDVPEPGDVVYLESSLYISHGRDDFRGGKATVVRVTTQVSGSQPQPFIEVAEDRGTLYNWEHLAPRQTELRARFGEQWAHPDPDLRPEFNEP